MSYVTTGRQFVPGMTGLGALGAAEGAYPQGTQFQVVIVGRGAAVGRAAASGVIEARGFDIVSWPNPSGTDAKAYTVKLRARGAGPASAALAAAKAAVQQAGGGPLDSVGTVIALYGARPTSGDGATYGSPACSARGGQCRDVSVAANVPSGFTTVVGLCPGPANIKCVVPSGRVSPGRVAPTDSSMPTDTIDVTQAGMFDGFDLSKLLLWGGVASVAVLGVRWWMKRRAAKTTNRRHNRRRRYPDIHRDAMLDFIRANRKEIDSWIRSSRRTGARRRLDDMERQNWILADKYLRAWAKSEGALV